MHGRDYKIAYDLIYDHFCY